MQTVGEILRAEREKRGMTVKDVEKGTSIRALYIQAIEDGNYSVLPGEVYLKGFIRNYASFLDMDPQKMMEVYRQNLQPQPQGVNTAKAPVAEPVPPTPIAPEKVAAPEVKPEPEKREQKKAASGGSGLKWLAIILLIIAAGVGGWMAFFYQTQPTPPPKPAPVAPVNPAPPPAPVQTPPPAPVKQAPAAKPITVVAKFTGESWANVIADGKELYEGVPRVGESFTWTAEKTMNIKLGNAAGVDLTYNGQPQGQLGSDGEVLIKTFSANTMPNPNTTKP